jgi:hypothetical protein
VLDRVCAHLRLEQEAGGYAAQNPAGDDQDGVYRDIARLIGATAHEIALVESATVGWTRAFYALAGRDERERAARCNAAIDGPLAAAARARVILPSEDDPCDHHDHPCHEERALLHSEGAKEEEPETEEDPAEEREAREEEPTAAEGKVAEGAEGSPRGLESPERPARPSSRAWASCRAHPPSPSPSPAQFPIIDPKEGPYPNRGSCVFAQTSVMRAGTSRDGRQQSRLIRGNKDGFEICTVDHQKDGAVRLDATITYQGDANEVGVYAHDDEVYEHDKYFKVYQPNAGDRLHPPDAGFKRYDMDGNIPREWSSGAAERSPPSACACAHPVRPSPPAFDVEMSTVGWWYLSCGRPLG